VKAAVLVVAIPGSDCLAKLTLLDVTTLLDGNVQGSQARLIGPVGTFDFGHHGLFNDALDLIHGATHRRRSKSTLAAHQIRDRCVESSRRDVRLVKITLRHCNEGRHHWDALLRNLEKWLSHP
jgi:hypothetical protein